MGTVSQIAVTPASTTIYTVTGTANGCSSSANITVVVNPLPTVSISPSVNPICPGSSTTLTGLGATSYVWNNSLGTTNPVVATPAATTIYTVTGTLLGCTNTASITVVVNPVVTVTASVNTVCAGLLVTFTANGAAGYVWSNGLGTTNPVTANPVTTTTYTVTGTLNGCTNMASVTVNVIPNPTLSITSSSNSLCPGTSTTMTAGGASTYAWSNGLGTLNQVSLTPASTTTYTVTGTTNGCNSTANTTIVVNPTPTINISTSANPVCIGSSTTLTATGALNYMWNPGTGLNSTTNNSVVATPNVSTTYNVVGTDVHGCTGSASVFVDVININTTATAVNDHCGQAIGKLTAVPSGICSQGFTYLWNTFPQQSTQIVNNVLAGTYTVTVTCSGCVATATAVVGNIGGPSAFITNKANTTCGLPDGMASVAESGGTSPFSYLWSDGQNTPLLSNVGAGTYTVTVDDVAGCSATTSVTIMGSAALLVSTSSTFSACNIDNGTATVVVTQGVGNYSYAWSVNPAQNTPTATGLAAGNYTVTVSDSLCTVTEMVSVLNPQGPHAYFTADHESLTFGEGDVNFQNNSSGNIVNWQWFFGDGSPAMSGPIAQHNFMDVGTYYVTLQVTDSNGCTNSYVDTIVVNEIFAFYIPNTFTPNGDGLNDVFQPKGSNVSPDDYEMDIFDRWGTVVFTSTDFEKGWNGTVKNKGKQNKDITMGVYYYQISLKDLKGKPHTYSGQINLIP